ncbi:hypothetical protein AWH62_12645 [Maricaulis sp. W15]|uniref:M48 family metallopeptidase n=1 Tax=Maricaulis sp. W15 TaxID=1772333 RepID=UPI000948BDFF|nr:M48 family metallopeptidase [Maricaulis sp. W15]OLF71390.1 hypothetical protein AWH62_12645 [Maricaulis sp. W15]
MLNSLTRLGLAAGLAVSLAACASTDHGVRSAGDRPMDLSSTEASLWYQTDEAESRLQASGQLNSDPALNAWVNARICEVAGTFCDDLRLYILESPTFNASMAPNGMAIVNTGLLLRAETTDELAFVLGHEFVHFEENHFLERHAAMRNANVTSTVLGSVIGVAGGGGLSSFGSLLAYGGALSFSRSQETEADTKGLIHATEAGYSADAGAAIWSNLLDELTASDHDEVTRRGNDGGAFGTHPDIDVRIASLTAQAADLPVHDGDRAAYRRIIRPFLQDWLDMHIVRRDHGATLALVDRLAGQGEDLGVLQYARGRIYAMRADDALALAEFEAATRHADAPADAWRAIGEMRRAQGDNPAAAAAFQAYLDHSPQARDRYLIERLITDLTGTQP